MLFDKIFKYTEGFAKAGALSTESLKGKLFSGSEENKILRETSPESIEILENISLFISSSGELAKEQRDEATTNHDWMNVDSVDSAVRKAADHRRSKR